MPPTRSEVVFGGKLESGTPREAMPVAAPSENKDGAGKGGFDVK